MPATNWYKLSNTDNIFTPALLIYEERVLDNSRKMIQMAGDASRLRPHVKTHKMEEIVSLQIELGIQKFKCATIAEAEMLARAGAKDILLAMQPVGPAVERFVKLMVRFPASRFSCIVDSAKVAQHISDEVDKFREFLEGDIWIDLNVGMNRTGIAPGPEAIQLYKDIYAMSWLRIKGLHVYDGHIHDADLSTREKKCNDAFVKVADVANELVKAGMPYPEIVAGGTPSFPIHLKREGIQLSPGTATLWDGRSQANDPAMGMKYAALILTRVISKPSPGLITLDCGTKSMASEVPQPRIDFPELENFEVVSQNEEHLVIKTDKAEALQPGDILYGVPYHICPTVEHYDYAYWIKDGVCIGKKEITARGRQLTI